MPQIGFYVGAAGAGIFNIPLGLARLHIAWDHGHHGPNNPIGVVYKSVALSNQMGIQRIATTKPVSVAPYTKPSFNGAFEPLGLDRVKFSMTTSTNISDWVDVTLDAFFEDKKVYSATDTYIRAQIWGTFPATFTYEGEMEMLSSHEHADDWYELLMTPRKDPIKEWAGGQYGNSGNNSVLPGDLWPF